MAQIERDLRRGGVHALVIGREQAIRHGDAQQAGIHQRAADEFDELAVGDAMLQDKGMNRARERRRNSSRVIRRQRLETAVERRQRRGMLLVAKLNSSQQL